MKFISVIIVLVLFTDPFKISKINRVKAEAKKAFQSGDYKTAAEKYTFLVDSLDIQEDEVLLNLANAYYLQKDTANAFSKYQSLTQSINNEVASKANNQLGLMTNQRGKPEEALDYFKQAIRALPANNDARYNYEMLKKKLDAKNKEDQKNNKDKNKDENKKQEPSEFAKRLKAQADKLVAERQYKAAYDLMTDGLKKDQTVSSYQTFIDRIKDVDEIDK
jgi:tetratricopeptide (TPR) repeat protein